MPRVTFTHNLQRHVPVPEQDAPGETVRDIMDHVFRQYPAARGYVLDEQGEVRPHMVIFVNGRQIVDRRRLSDAVPADGEIHVMQALSGG